MDPVLKYCAVGRQLGYATYLSLDTITYVRIAFLLGVGLVKLIGLCSLILQV